MTPNPPTIAPPRAPAPRGRPLGARALLALLAMIFVAAAAAAQAGEPLRMALQTPIRGEVDRLAFSPDGRRLTAWVKGGFVGGTYAHATVTFDLATGRTFGPASPTAIEAWRPPDRRGQPELSAVRREVPGLRFGVLAPDGRAVAAGCRDGRVAIADRATGLVRARRQGPGEPAALVFSQDSTVLAAAFGDGTVEFLDAGTGAVRARRFGARRLPPLVRTDFGDERPTGLTFSADARSFALACEDGAIEVVDTASGRTTATLAGAPFLELAGATMSDDGRHVVLVPREGRVAVFDLRTGEVRRAPRALPERFFTSDGDGGPLENPIILQRAEEAPRAVRARGVAVVAAGAGIAGRAAYEVDLATGALRGPLEDEPAATDPQASEEDTSRFERVLGADAKLYLEPGAFGGVRVGGEAGVSKQLSPPRAIGVWDAATGKRRATLWRARDRWEPDHVLDRTARLLWPGPRGDVVIGSTPTEWIHGDGWRETWVWDAATGRERARLPCDARGAAFDAEGRRALLTGDDIPVAILLDTASGAEVARFALVGEDGTVVVTPDGRYMGTREGFAALAVVEGAGLAARAHPLDVFEARLHRPDVVLERLGAPAEVTAAYAAAWRKRVARLGITEAEATGAASVPEIEVLGGRAGVDATEKRLRLRVRATDPGGGLARLHVFVNQVPVHGSAGLDLGPSAGARVERDLEVELTAGRNDIQVSARNHAGLESRRESFSVTYIGPAPRPACYVVAVGVSAYRDASANLALAAKDARDVAALFQGLEGGQFSEVHALTLLDGDAVREKILAARDFLARGRPDDTAVLFVAGHGLLDGKLDYRFATHDIDFASPEGRGLRYDDLEGLVDGIAARTKLILMDTCHAGEVDRDEAPPPSTEVAASGATASTVTARGFAPRLAASISGAARAAGATGALDPRLLRRLFADLRRGSGALVISSASGLELAFESAEWRNGLFTHAVITGLRDARADRDRDFAVRFSELRDHVSETVARLSGGRQTPTARRELIGADPELVQRRPPAPAEAIPRVPERHRPQALAFSPDGALLATAGRDGRALILDVRSGAIVRALEAHAALDEIAAVLEASPSPAEFPVGARAVRFHPFAPLVGTSGADGRVRIFDARSGAEVARFGPRLVTPGEDVAREHGFSFAFTPDGAGVALEEAGCVVVRSLETGEVARTLAMGPAGPITAAGGVLAAIEMPARDEEGNLKGGMVLRTFNAATGEALRAHDVPVRSARPLRILERGGSWSTLWPFTAEVALDPLGRRLALGLTREVLLLDADGGARTLSLEGGGAALAIAPGGAVVATTGAIPSLLTLRDASTGAALRTIDVPIERTAPNDGRQRTRLTAVAFSPAGGLMATATDEPHTPLRLFQVDVPAAPARPGPLERARGEALLARLLGWSTALWVKEVARLGAEVEALAAREGALSHRAAWRAWREVEAAWPPSAPAVGPAYAALRARIEARREAAWARLVAAAATPQPETWTARPLERDERGWCATLDVKGVAVRLRYCPPGRFTMGTPGFIPERLYQDERPRTVHLTRGFWLAETECTRAFWTAVTGEDRPAITYQNEPRRPLAEEPMTMVSFVEARDFARGLGHGARLPTEAEWEYACRAGTTTPWSTGERLRHDQARLARMRLVDRDYEQGKEDLGAPRPVGSYAPNPWGLKDMHGNVEEWCFPLGLYSGPEATDPLTADGGGALEEAEACNARGGSFVDDDDAARSAAREDLESSAMAPSSPEAQPQCGFRVLIPATPPPGDR